MQMRISMTTGERSNPERSGKTNGRRKSIGKGSLKKKRGGGGLGLVHRIIHARRYFETHLQISGEFQSRWNLDRQFATSATLILLFTVSNWRKPLNRPFQVLVQTCFIFSFYILDQ